MQKEEIETMRVKRVALVLGTVFFLASMLFTSSVSAYAWYAEEGGYAELETSGVPYAKIAEYPSLSNLLLGGRTISLVSGSVLAKGYWYVRGRAEKTGWVTATVKWYMKGTCLHVSPSLFEIPWLGGGSASVTVEFWVTDKTAGAQTKTRLLDKHAPWSTDGAWFYSSVSVPLYYFHTYTFSLHYTVRASSWGQDYAIADFGGIWWSDSKLKYGYINVPYTEDMTQGIGGPPPEDGGGGGCPILSVFDGSEYVEEGLLPIHASEDVVTGHTLTVTPQRVRNAYLMRLTEHPLTNSYIDQVKLFATLEDGRTVQLPLLSAAHSEDGNVLPELLFSDDVRTDTLGAELNNGESESIDLGFAALPPPVEVESFMFVVEGYNSRIK